MLAHFPVRAIISAAILLFLCFTSLAQPVLQPSENPFLIEFIEKRLANIPQETGRKIKFRDVCAIETDPIAERIFREYGAMFAVSDEITIPPKCIFESNAEVEKFQAGLKTKTILVGSIPIELQQAAADALSAAVTDALLAGKRISALDGGIAGKRNYGDTLRIWRSRFYPAADHWVWMGKITRAEAEGAAVLPFSEHVKKVMEWEARGYYFSTDFLMSIFNSVAPPGTSQHLSSIAFDVVEASDPDVRSILNKHGWFQTIKSDEPHFTYLGVSETDLPKRGLQPLSKDSRIYWTPNVKR